MSRLVKFHVALLCHHGSKHSSISPINCALRFVSIEHDCLHPCPTSIVAIAPCLLFDFPVIVLRTWKQIPKLIIVTSITGCLFTTVCIVPSPSGHFNRMSIPFKARAGVECSLLPSGSCCPQVLSFSGIGQKVNGFRPPMGCRNSGLAYCQQLSGQPSPRNLALLRLHVHIT